AVVVPTRRDHLARSRGADLERRICVVRDVCARIVAGAMKRPGVVVPAVAQANVRMAEGEEERLLCLDLEKILPRLPFGVEGVGGRLEPDLGPTPELPIARRHEEIGLDASGLVHSTQDLLLGRA